MASFRPVLLMLLVVIDGAALVFAMLGGSSLEDAGWALFLIVCFSPVKGITYRRLGGRRPYPTAILATFSWQAVGLPIDLDSFALIMAASFAVSILVDFVALVAMDAGPVRRCLFLAIYGSLLVHLLTMGFFVFMRSVAIGLVLLAGGVGLFLGPAFYTDLFQHPQTDA
jgi:hypothetical protein